jgi:AcrR family transcriptional regulator
MPQVGVARRGAALAKRGQILAGARQVFSEFGLERASIDVIAARAGVSKPTIYNHFPGKDALFVACATEEAEEMRAGLSASMTKQAGGVEQVLQCIGEKAMSIYLSPSVVKLYRHIIAEAPQFPDLGQTVFDRGFAVMRDAIAARLDRYRADGTLRIDDTRLAAVEFLSLCQGDLVARARLAILEVRYRKRMREVVRHAVRTFVRAYRP